MGVHEEVLRGGVGARGDEQLGLMRLAGLRLGRIRVERVEHQHGTRLVILAEAGVVREGGVRAEHVIAVVVAHLGTACRNHQTLAGERLAQCGESRRRELRGFERLDLRFAGVPTGLHEINEGAGIGTQRTVVHTVAHRLIRAGGVRLLAGLVFLVLLGDDFAHRVTLLRTVRKPVPFENRLTIPSLY